MRNIIRITAAAALLFCPAIAQAQQPLGGWRGLETGSLDTFYVTDDAGRRTEGKLLRLDTDSLVMLVDGMEQRFDAARVQRIDKRGDSLKNGTRGPGQVVASESQEFQDLGISGFEDLRI